MEPMVPEFIGETFDGEAGFEVVGEKAPSWIFRILQAGPVGLIIFRDFPLNVQGTKIHVSQFSADERTVLSINPYLRL